MPSVLIDRKSKKIISIVEGQKLKKTSEYEVFHTNKIDESEILKELNSLGILSETIHFDVLFKRDALGDVLMLMPVITGLKKEYPQLKIVLQTDECLVPLFEYNKIFDSVVNFNNNVAGDFNIDLCSIGDFIAEKDGRENKHRTIYYEEEIKKTLKGYSFDLNYSFNISFRESISLRDKILDLKNLKVLLAPKSKSYFRMWGYRNESGNYYYKELELIEKCQDWDFIVLDNSYLPEFDDKKNVLNLSGQTDILEFATICKYVDLGIVPDSGTMHLLGNFNIPTIAIFGNVSEPEYRISQYSSIFPITTPTKDFNSKSYEKSPYCHVSNCWAGQVHDCVGKLHEKWCTKEISIETILKEYEKKVKNYKKEEHGVNLLIPDDSIGNRKFVEENSSSITDINGTTEYLVCYRDAKGLGDIVTTLATIQDIRKKFPKIKILYYAREPISDILKHHPDIYEIRSVKEKIERNFPIFAFSHPCPAASYEANMGTDYLKNRIQIFKESVGLKNSRTLPKLYLTDEEINFGKIFVGETKIGLVYNSAEKWRDYDKNEDILLSLKKRNYDTIVIDDNINIKGFKSTAGFSIREVTSVINALDVIITPDTGWMHVSAGLDKKMITLFGSMNPDNRTDGYNSINLTGHCPYKKQYCWYNICTTKDNYVPCMTDIDINLIVNTTIGYSGYISKNSSWLNKLMRNI